MRTPTHVSFGVLFILGIGLLVGISINWSIAIFAIIGALLPDIDTPQSILGRFLRPMSAYIERKFGHRQATHSLLAVLILGLITIPLICVNLFCWIALFSGYLSHLLIDSVNKSGVPLFYPSSIRAVMPKPEKWRIAVGTKAETIVMVIILIAVFALYPLNQIGLFRTLHRMIKDTQSAIADYRSWADEYQVYANVKGVFSVSQQPIVSQFEVLGMENRNTLVVYDARAEKIYTVGTDNNANIYPKKIHCIKGEPINPITKKVSLKYELLSNLINHIPLSGQTFIKGVVKTADRISINNDPDTYPTLKPSQNSLVLQYARKQDFLDSQVNTVFALSGDVYLRTILPAAEATRKTLSYQQPRQVNAMGVVKYERPLRLSASLRATFNSPYLFTIQPATGQPAQPSRVHPVEMSIHNVRSPNEILIKEGEYIKAGQVIACLTYNDKKLKLQEQTIQRQIDQLTSKPTNSHALFLASQKVKVKKRENKLQQEIFKATQKLYDSKAISKTAFAIEKQKLAQREAAKIEAEEHFWEVKEKLEWEQKQRQFQIDQAILKLNAVQDEREQNKICSAVNARVLFIRSQAIHNNNLTIVIKLLVNAPEPSSLPQSIPKPKIESPEPKEMPKKENFIKVIDRNVAAEPMCPPVSKSVFFLQNTPVYKKTHTKFYQKGGKNAVKKTISFNHSRGPVFLLHFLRYQPIASEHYHKPSFFT